MIYQELKEGLTELSKAKYGRVIVKKLFMYCDKSIKTEMIEKRIIGHVMSLMKHKATLPFRPILSSMEHRVRDCVRASV